MRIRDRFLAVLTSKIGEKHKMEPVRDQTQESSLPLAKKRRSRKTSTSQEIIQVMAPDTKSLEESKLPRIQKRQRPAKANSRLPQEVIQVEQNNSQLREIAESTLRREFTGEQLWPPCLRSTPTACST